MSCSPPRDGEECAHPRSSLDLDPSAYASTLSDGSEAAVVEESSSEASIADGVAVGAVHTESADVPVAAAVARPSFPRGHSLGDKNCRWGPKSCLYPKFHSSTTKLVFRNCVAGASASLGAKTSKQGVSVKGR